MAKKGSTGLLGMVAFIAIILNAVAWLLVSLDLGGNISAIMTAVASIALLLVVLYVAYDFAKKQTQLWRIIFYVLAILSIAAVLFGTGRSFV